MRQRQILLSGDYWHSDFRTILSNFDVPVTMIPIEKLDEFVAPPEQFDLIVLAESRRDQIQPESVDRLRQQFAGIPIVNLLGSWCEGETRSGDPLPGTIRVYWHQWLGQYDKFVRQLAADEVTDWHLPPTTTLADRMNASTPSADRDSELIGVSAWTRTHFEMLADSLKTLGYQSRWLERSTWDAEAIQLLTAICIDATSVNDDLVNRIQWLRATFPEPPMVLLLNFPRANEVESANKLGVSAVLSKPFELADLLTAMMRACGENTDQAKNTLIQ